MKTTLLLITIPFFLNSVKCECTSLIFCQGDLLRIVQSAGLFKDSKTFVDMSLIGTADTTLKEFELLMARTRGTPSREEVVEFVQTHFQASSSELEYWFPLDYQVNPPFLRKIKNFKMRSFAKHVHDIWPVLGRKIRSDVMKNSMKYTIIPVPHGFIIPGGRFREFYYWDSYWVVKGLLISDMTRTAKGMIDNLLRIVEMYGFVPNGGRIYYLDRSQPPLLTLMVEDFIQKTHEISWLRKKIHILDKEMNYWLNMKSVTIELNGLTYHLARFLSSGDTPRPESYIEDVRTASTFQSVDDQKQCYTNLRTGAESGWDFTSRWFFDREGGNRATLSSINPTRLLPVDLNAFLCKSFKIMYNFHLKLRNKEKATFYYEKWREWEHGIEDILYNEQDGIWYDYDIEYRRQRKHFYCSNFAPLWTESYNPRDKYKLGKRAVEYLHSQEFLDSYPGGLPASLTETGEQWDAPNGWAPLQSIVVLGLDKTGDASAREMARLIAHRFLNSVLKVTMETEELFEKYSAKFDGVYGGGGEYEVQTGFGWTNGVILELIDYYYVRKKGLPMDKLNISDVSTSRGNTGNGQNIVNQDE